MALINLHTNLKSLRFGNDIQGGGSSGLPYIQPGLPEDSPSGEYLAGIARNSADWPLRGGTYSTVASTEDSVRISRFLTDFPNGSIFTAKQVGLQKSNPNIETGGKTSRLNTQTYNLNANLLAQVFEQGTGIHISRAGANANELGPDGLQNKYEYVVSHKESYDNRLVTLYNTKVNTNLLDTIDSLGAAQTLGIPLSNDNILFDYEMGPDSLYGDGNTTIFKATDFKGVSINTGNASKGQVKPLIELGEIPNYASGKFNSIIRNKFPRSFSIIKQSEELPEFYTDDNGNLVPKESGILNDAYLKQEDINKDLVWNVIETKNTLAQQGGTEISGDYIRPDQVPADIPLINQFGNLTGYSALLSSKDSDLTSYKLQDFRSKSIDPQDPARSQARKYNEPLVNIATRVGIGSPGGRLKDQRKYINQVNYGGQDQVNMIPLYADATDPFNGKPEARDLVKFAFEVINNDGVTGTSLTYKNKKGETVSNSDIVTTKVHFRAFLTNFLDNHAASWNGQRYMGRGEEFFTYQGFNRDVSFQFKVVAQSKQEMLPLWQKLNYLASSLYPDYSDQGFMRGNLHKLTIGEYFYRTPGILKSMNISVDDNYPWEIKYSEPETARSFETKDFTNTTTPGNKDFIQSNSDADMMELPQVVNVSCTFTPILNELPSLSRVTETEIQKRHMLISDHGVQENFINRLENPASKIPFWNTEVIKFDPERFNINTPTGDINS